MVHRIALSKILLTSGETIVINNGVTAIVGPNNSGKSLLLKELRNRTLSAPHRGHNPGAKVIQDVEFSFAGTPEGYFADLAKVYELRPAGQSPHDGYINADHVTNGSVFVELAHVERVWQSTGSLGSEVGGLFLNYVNAERRLQMTNSVDSFDKLNSMPSNPLQHLLGDSALEGRLNQLVLEAFQTGITVYRNYGPTTHLHLGQVSSAALEDPQSEEYLEEVRSLPLVHHQGDGMRAFIGMAMSIIANQARLVIIDEPEAFLHPPQARRFGQFLAEITLRNTDTQVIVATHSQDLIAGLTSQSAQEVNVSVVRLTRTDTTNHVAQLEATAVQEFYKDPLMKHYDMLNGLFSTGVVLCEADSDCVYYRAAVDTQDPASFRLVQEAHFTHTSGKARIYQAIRAFRQAAVPVAAIVDFDILQNKAEFERLTSAAGIPGNQVLRLRRKITATLDSEEGTISRETFRTKIQEILNANTEISLHKSEIGRIRDALRSKSGWTAAKRNGVECLPPNAATAFDELTNVLQKHGIFILKHGELERLHPEVANRNKSLWLQTVIEEEQYANSPALPMLQKVSQFLEASQLRTTSSRSNPDATQHW